MSGCASGMTPSKIWPMRGEIGLRFAEIDPIIVGGVGIELAVLGDDFWERLTLDRDRTTCRDCIENRWFEEIGSGVDLVCRC